MQAVYRHAYAVAATVHTAVAERCCTATDAVA